MATFDAGMNFSYVLRLVVNQGSQSIPNNSSVANWYLEILKGVGSGRYAGGVQYWSTNINGNVYSGTIPSYDFRAYSSLLLASGSTTIWHNADGTKVFYSSGAYSDGPWGELGNVSVGGNLWLTTIPRATNPTVPATMIAGQPYTIGLPRATGSFTHKVEFQFINSTFELIASSAPDSVAWTPSLDLVNRIPNVAASNGVVRVTTFSGATQIGSPVSKTFSLQVPESIIPKFTTITATENVTLVQTTVGAFTQNLSKLNLAITGAAGERGSTIVSATITVGGQTVNSLSGVTPGVINAHGSVPIVGVVTDSRGRTATKTVNINVFPYAAPVIDTALTTLQRATATGVPNEEGTYARVNLTASVSSLLVSSTQKNSLTYQFFLKERDAVNFPTTPQKTVTLPDGQVTFNLHDYVGVFGIEKSWNVRIVVKDKFNSNTIERTMAVGDVFMHWDASLGLGIGKYRQDGMLDVKGDVYANSKKVLVTGGVAGTDITSGTIPSARIPQATTALRGGALLATQAEVDAGTDTTRYVSPATLRNSATLPWAVAAGVDWSNSGYATVVYPAGRFTVTPVLTTTVQSTSNNNVAVVWFGSQTVSSFSVIIFSIGGVVLTGNVAWQAMQMTSTTARG